MKHLAMNVKVFHANKKANNFTFMVSMLEGNSENSLSL
jgi:hypothetical protein